MIGYPPRSPGCVEVESRCVSCGHVFRARKWLPKGVEVGTPQFGVLTDKTRRELTEVAWVAFRDHGCKEEEEA